ncbi:hypothetical protein [Pseudomonas farris]
MSKVLIGGSSVAVTVIVQKNPANVQRQAVKQNPCGSGLAREEGGTVNIDVA